MEEKELPFEYKAVEEEAKSMDIGPLKRDVFGSTLMLPGSGEMLCLKIMLQSMDNVVLVTSGTASAMARAGLGVPVISASRPAEFAQGLSHGLADAKDPKVIVVADEDTTLSSLGSVVRMKENIMYVCLSNSMRFRQMARMMPGYAATASVAFCQDFAAKLKKACSCRDFSYIEVLAPNPSWGYETSNTVEIARLATECLLWPVYETEKGSVSITKRPDREEPVARFFSAVGKKPSDSELQCMQEEASRTWKLMQRSKQEA